MNPYGMCLRSIRKAAKVAIECTRLYIYIYIYIYIDIYIYIYIYIYIHSFSMCIEKLPASGHGMYSLLIMFEMLSGQPLIRYVLEV